MAIGRAYFGLIEYLKLISIIDFRALLLDNEGNVLYNNEGDPIFWATEFEDVS